jgi:hypothetical protein
VSAYADDGRLTGPALDVIAGFLLMQVEMEKVGPKVKTKDLLAYSPTTQPAAVHDACRNASIILVPPHLGVDVLGSPVGPAEYMQHI